MERLPDPIHWKRWGSTEDWRVSSRPQFYLYFSKVLLPVGILVVISLHKHNHLRPGYFTKCVGDLLQVFKTLLNINTQLYAIILTYTTFNLKTP